MYICMYIYVYFSLFKFPRTLGILTHSNWQCSDNDGTDKQQWIEPSFLKRGCHMGLSINECKEGTVTIPSFIGDSPWRRNSSIWSSSDSFLICGTFLFFGWRFIASSFVVHPGRFSRRTRTSLNLFATKFDQVLNILSKRAGELDYILIDPWRRCSRSLFFWLCN